MGGVGEPEDHVSIKTGREPTPSKLLALPTNIRLGCYWLAVTDEPAYKTTLKLSLKSFNCFAANIILGYKLAEETNALAYCT